MNIYTEITPNPLSIKFVLDDCPKKIPTLDFPDSVSAKSSILATLLFELSSITGVFFGSDRLYRGFITISKTESADWNTLIPEIKKIITDFMATDLQVAEFVENETKEIQNSDSEVVTKIKNLINEEIRPAVAMDGGDITFDSFEDGVVKVVLKGSCSGCPSSLVTLKSGIQALLTRMVPEVISVEAI